MEKNAEDLDMKEMVNLLLDLEAVYDDETVAKNNFVSIILAEGYVLIDSDAEELYNETKEIHLYSKIKQDRKDNYKRIFGENNERK